MHAPMHMVKQSSHLGSIAVCLLSLGFGALFLLERFGVYSVGAFDSVSLETKALSMAILLLLAGLSLAFILLDGHKTY